MNAADLADHLEMERPLNPAHCPDCATRARLVELLERELQEHGMAASSEECDLCNLARLALSAGLAGLVGGTLSDRVKNLSTNLKR